MNENCSETIVAIFFFKTNPEADPTIWEREGGGGPFDEYQYV